MNPICLSAPRISCLGSRSLVQTCIKVETPFSQRCFNTASSIPFRRKCISAARNGLVVRAWNGTNTPLWSNGGIRRQSTRIIKRFDDLPEDFDFKEGLRYRDNRVTKAEAKAIFGNVIDVHDAHTVLMKIHGQRVAGTIDHPMEHESIYHQRAFNRGLEWLRKNVPVDEIENSHRAVEAELALAEQEVVKDAERLGLWKPNASNKNMKDVYGESAFDKIRKGNEKKYAKEQKKKEEQLSQADEIQQNTGTLETSGAGKGVELRRKGEHPWLKYFEERSKVLPDLPPDITPFQRLWPSGLLCLGVVGASVLFAYMYTPPRKSARMFPDIPPSAATILTIIAINTAVTLMWRMPPFWRILNKYFVSVPGYPRAGALVGSVFSHQSWAHLFSNMFVLWLAGTRLHDEIGRGNFLALYMSAGVVGCFASTATWVFRRTLITSGLGASGSVCGILGTYLSLHAFDSFQLFGVFPPDNWPSITGIMFIIIMVFVDIKGLKVIRGHIDHVAHLGGWATGIATAGVLSMQAARKRKLERERRKDMSMLERIKEEKL